MLATALVFSALVLAPLSADDSVLGDRSATPHEAPVPGGAARGQDGADAGGDGETAPPQRRPVPRREDGERGPRLDEGCPYRERQLELIV